MDFNFNTFEEFMSFVKTEGKDIDRWSKEKINKFNNHVWKLQENPEFNAKYEVWVEDVIAHKQRKRVELYGKDAVITKPVKTMSK
jgi:hypothetical protein